MKKKLLVSFVICSIALTAMVPAAVAAKHKNNNIVVSEDGRQMSTVDSPSHVTPRNAKSDAKLTTIGGNLSSYPFATFFCCWGFTVAQGPPAFPFTTWTAVPFTPTADASVTRVEVSVGTYSSQSINFVISLMDDSNGLPGKSLKSWNAKAPNAYGSCCAVDVVNDAAGIPVKAGTQYWVAVKTNAKSDFFGGWAFNSTDMRQDMLAGYCKGPATYCGTTNNGKWAAGQQELPAFGVFGH